MNGRISWIRPIAVGALNSRLDKGFSLPIPQNITQYLKNPRVRTFDKFLFVDAEPDFTNLNFNTTV